MGMEEYWVEGNWIASVFIWINRETAFFSSEKYLSPENFREEAIFSRKKHFYWAQSTFLQECSFLCFFVHCCTFLYIFLTSLYICQDKTVFPGSKCFFLENVLFCWRKVLFCCRKMLFCWRKMFLRWRKLLFPGEKCFSPEKKYFLQEKNIFFMKNVQSCKKMYKNVQKYAKTYKNIQKTTFLEKSILLWKRVLLPRKNCFPPSIFVE